MLPPANAEPAWTPTGEAEDAAAAVPFEPEDVWPLVKDSVELSPEEGLTRRRERPVDVLIALDDGEEGFEDVVDRREHYIFFSAQWLRGSREPLGGANKAESSSE